MGEVGFPLLFSCLFRYLNPDSEKTFKDCSISYPDFAEKWQFHRKRAPFYLEKRL